jgi:hypothetical protein
MLDWHEELHELPAEGPLVLVEPGGSHVSGLRCSEL